MPDPVRLPRLLTERAAAETLGVSVYTMRRARKAGKIRYTVIGGRVRYTEAHLVGYIEQQERVECPPDDSDKSANTGYRNGQTVPLGAVPGSTSGPDRRAVHLSAQRILTKQN